jgi:anti-sigma28 factor (negative regulator of flagellin synthesis)
MDGSRTDSVQRVHAQIAAGAYRVDVQAVAEALLRRLLAGRALDRD